MDWTDFREHLIDTFLVITDRTFVVVNVTGSRVWVQFSAGPDYLAVQAVGDEFLPEDSHLDDAARAAMTAAGWATPTVPDPYWGIQLTLPALTTEYTAAAQACVVALRDVHRIPDPSVLTYRAWREPDRLVEGQEYTDEQVAALDRGQNPLPLPALGLPTST
ncbi:MAG: TY-Chap domain-containing protein [Dermatophilaceae bacterium]